MKKLITGVLSLLAFNLFAQSDSLVWETNVRKAAEVSIAENKPLFLFFTGSDWCGVCKKLEREVFAYPQFHEWAKKNVVLVELDFPRNRPPDPELEPQNRMFKEMFGITGYPTIVFVNPTKVQDKFYYARIGNIGYMPGGPDVWLNAATQQIASRK